MTMNRDLFLAILSMDSYNRGYGRGINFGQNTGQVSRNEVGARLGNATILRDANDVEGIAQAAGFYALAYTVSGVSGMADGTTVIAFRGTDVAVTAPWNATEASDAWNGFGLAVGNYRSPQAQLAVDFYRAVAGAIPGTDLLTANIEVTGHSLGGGLAGYVGTLYQQSGILYDNMAFEQAALAANIDALINPTVRRNIYGTLAGVPNTSEAGLTAFATSGEFLTELRGVGPQTLQASPVESGASGFRPLQLHSMALLTSLLYARDQPLTGIPGTQY